MPDGVWDLISHEDGSTTHLHGAVRNLAELLRHDKDVASAYLCCKDAVQVCKFRKEGAHFCGYRNIQMLLLGLGSTSGDQRPEMPANLAIPHLQEMIEEAWDTGLNSHGKILTGGIQRTRKHIGTSEVRRYFCDPLLYVRSPKAGRDSNAASWHPVHGYGISWQRLLAEIIRCRRDLFQQVTRRDGLYRCLCHKISPNILAKTTPLVNHCRHRKVTFW